MWGEGKIKLEKIYKKKYEPYKKKYEIRVRRIKDRGGGDPLFFFAMK